MRAINVTQETQERAAAMGISTHDSEREDLVEGTGTTVMQQIAAFAVKHDVGCNDVTLLIDQDDDEDGYCKAEVYLEVMIPRSEGDLLLAITQVEDDNRLMGIQASRRRRMQYEALKAEFEGAK